MSCVVIFWLSPTIAAWQVGQVAHGNVARRAVSPVALDLDSFQLLAAAAPAIDIAEVQGKAAEALKSVQPLLETVQRDAVPFIQKSVEVAVPEIQKNVEAAVPVLQQTAKDLTPVVVQAGEVLAPAASQGLVKAGSVLGTVAGEAAKSGADLASTAAVQAGAALPGLGSELDKLLTANVSPEQKQTVDQVTKAVGAGAKVAADTAGPVIAEGIKQATPVVQEAGKSLAAAGGKFAREELRQALTFLDDFLRD